MLSAFINANRKLCWNWQRRLPQAQVDLHDLYERTVADHINANPGLKVVDVGGGKACPFKRRLSPNANAYIIAVDVSADELEHNRDVDEKRVADITRGLPFGPREVDLIVSRSVLEHLTDTEAFVRASYEALKPGGHCIHVLPSRYAPFAIANRLMPNAIARRLLDYLEPFNQGICGFPAHYNRCYPSAMAAAFAGAGFEVSGVTVNYYQSKYYDFFAPLYALSVGYELTVRALGLRNLGASLMIIARKPADGAAPSMTARSLSYSRI
ncbi:MAG TPA: class I SAM-dependent methyltransferase [Armatimonadota bacterium]|jgi:SAM-dependent methyltransferase